MSVGRKAVPPADHTHLLEQYRVRSGMTDEMLDASGGIRPLWTTFLDGMAALSPEELQTRAARADAYLQDSGVHYRNPGDASNAARDWPLNRVPVMVAAAEWNELTTGLSQRADLLESIITDLYTDNTLAARGLIPASLISGNPEWLRPLVGVKPASGHYLHFIGFDVGRGPDGRWWVLGDRTQAPSGAGFALENRVATTLAYPDEFARGHIHRLAHFFRGFRKALQDLAHSDDNAIAVLTPGPLTDTYYEHAYLARYLGLMLVEGEDLAIRDGELFVRTVNDLQPMKLLWRRIDSNWLDPLELEQRSRIGRAGLLGAIRNGAITLVNAAGSGALEMRGLQAFLPQISLALTGQPLAVPTIATWWLGQENEQRFALDNRERLMIGSALSTNQPLDTEEGAFVAGRKVGGGKRTLEQRIAESAGELVAQELVTLSTTPVLIGDRLESRPLTIRVFLARTAQGWIALPGGFARIGATMDTQAIAMRNGAMTADVWVVDDKPVAADTMLPGSGEARVHAHQTFLPSRAADNLVWLGRYVERSESLIRVLRAYHTRGFDPKHPNALAEAMQEFLEEVEGAPEEPIPSGLINLLFSATFSAGHIRDRFSLDGWAALADLAKTARNMQKTARPGDDAAHAMSVLLRKITGFSGLVHENMYRFSSWRFLTIGKALERAIGMAEFLAHFADKDSPDGSFDMALEVGDSVMAHRRRYSILTSRESVISMLALDNDNPRSIVYNLEVIRDQLELLPQDAAEEPMSDAMRAILPLHANLAVLKPQDVDGKVLTDVAEGVAQLYDILSSRYLR